MINVVVVEDHPVYLAGLRQVIDRTDSIDVLGAFGSIEDFEAPPGKGTVALLDLGLPGMNGSAAVAHVARLGCRVLVVSASSGRAELLGALAGGALGFLGKDADADQIVQAIRVVASGRSYISPTLASLLLDTEDQRPRFSGREREILEQLAEGASDKAIAHDLGIKLCTVHSHLDRIRDKTGCRRRAELTRLAIDCGLVTSKPAAPTD